MDNITHTLTGLALSRAGLNGKTRFATLALLIGSNLPDVDVAWSGWGSTIAYLKYHRGITHSLLGVSVLGVALAGVIYLWGRRRPARRGLPPLNGPWLLASCGLATATHLLMDFTNAYGVRPFLPFSGRWYAWDIMFIFDPLLLLFLVAGLGLPAIFGLISEEVGAGRGGYRRGALAALAATAVLWGVRDLAHRRVLDMLDAHVYGGENPVRLGAFPQPANPLSWIGVVETDSAFYVLAADALGNGVAPATARIFHKPEPSPALDAALKTPTGVIFSSFARFLWAEAIENEDGYDVRLEDLRFTGLRPGLAAGGFVAHIRLNHELKAVSQTFSFAGRRD